MSFIVAVPALVLLMFVAYRGFSVILFAPIAAMLAVLVTDPAAVPTGLTHIFALTCIKTLAVFVIIALYYATCLV